MKNLHRPVTFTSASEVVVVGQDVRQPHGVRKNARQVRRRRSREQQQQARSSFIHQGHNLTDTQGQRQQGQAQMQYSPSHQAALHAGHNPQAHTAALSINTDDMEQERARQEQIHNALQWQMKTQRVSEYSNYLRARASQGARSVVGSVAGSSASSSYVGSSLAPVLTEQGGEVNYAVNDMDLSGYLAF
jgi:hypothetical protein